MKYAQIKNGKVENIIEINPSLVINGKWAGMNLIEALESTAIGDELINGALPLPPLPEPLSQEEIAAMIQAAVINGLQAAIDNFAKTRNYDNALSAASYAASINPQFKAEALRVVELRDQIWAYAYAELAAVQNGDRDMPISAEDFVNEVLTAVPLSWNS